MNEHQLLCFLTVSRTLNFSAAARELYCTQPALSYQIRSLEKELDAALFRRTTTQVALTEADAALYLPFGPLPPEIRCETIISNRFYLIAAPEHPFSGQSSVELSDLAGQQIFYEPLYQDMVDFAQKQPGMPYSTPVWRMVENYESVYAELLAGRGMFLCPMIYPAFPAGWHIPLHLSIPDTRLLTLRDDPRPEICTLRKVFAEVYAEREKLIKAL